MNIITIEFKRGLAIPSSPFGDFTLLNNTDEPKDLHQYNDDYWAFEFGVPEDVEVDHHEYDDVMRSVELFLSQFNKEFHVSMAMKKELNLCFVLCDYHPYHEIFGEDFIFDHTEYLRDVSVGVDPQERHEEVKTVGLGQIAS